MRSALSCPAMPDVSTTGPSKGPVPPAMGSAGRSPATPHARVTTPAPIQYRVSMPEPATPEFEVEMRVPALPGLDAVEIVFPTWAPGSYLVRDFVRHVFRLAVTDERGRALARERRDKQRWRIRTGGRAFVVRYRVF